MKYKNLEFNEKTKMYVNLVSVSRSGMTRTMKFYIIVDNELQNITNVIAETLDKKLDKNYCLKVQGCGMDMVFYTLDAFARRIGFKDSCKLLWVNYYHII